MPKYVEPSLISESFRKGIGWLEDEIKFDEQKIRNQIMENEKENKKNIKH